MLPTIILIIVIVVLTISLFFVKNKAIKALLSFLSLVGFFIIAVLLAVLTGPYFMGFQGFWLSFLLCGAAFIICILFAWKPFTEKTRIIIAIVVLAAIAVIGVAIAGHEFLSGRRSF